MYGTFHISKMNKTCSIGENFIKYKIKVTIFILDNLVLDKKTEKIIVCHNLTFFKPSHKQNTNRKLRYQIKEKKILRHYLFLVFLRIFFLENYEFLLQLREL